MKIVALEEHYCLPEIHAAWRALPPERRDLILDFGKGSPTERSLEALGQSRIDDMDRMGVDIQVLSLTTPGVQVFEPDTAIKFAQASNAAAAATIATFPSRFQALATLPTPASAADNVAELKRCVEYLGFKGALINGRTLERNLDHADFLPIFEAAAELHVPIYVHPQIPQRAVRDAYYSSLGEPFDTLFPAAGYGWHVETGIQAVRLILSGLFDRLPDLQIILGHWGELAVHFTQRLDILTQRLDMLTTLPPQSRHLTKSVSDYFKSNFYVTPGGLFYPGSLERTIELIGIDRIMFAVDYPFVATTPGEARKFFADAALSEADKHKIAHGNWQQLTGQ
jgi:uncharacterized protein